jgi:hypothetical protein
MVGIEADPADNGGWSTSRDDFVSSALKGQEGVAVHNVADSSGHSGAASRSITMTSSIDGHPK